jgi:hypothetical protein
MAGHDNASVEGNGEKTGLNVGNNPFTITCKAEDGTTQAYTVTVIRALSGDATLKSPIVSPGSLTPPFNPATTNYTVNVANAITAVTITGEAGYNNASVEGNGEKTGLKVGDNIFEIICTDENESSITYTVNVIRNEEQHINFPASAVEKTYGDADFTVVVNGYAPHGVQYTSEAPDVATVADGGRVHIVKTGVTRIKAATPSVPGTHDIAEAAYTLTVRQKQLTIDASASRVAAKVYDGTVTASVASVAFAGVGVNELAKDADYTVANARYNSAEVFEATEVMATVALVPTSIPAQNYILADGAFRKSAVIGKAYLGG